MNTEILQILQTPYKDLGWRFSYSLKEPSGRKFLAALKCFLE